MREIIEDFEEKVTEQTLLIPRKISFHFSKEKARLEEILLSEGGQQQLALRTYKVQLNKQTEKIQNLQNELEQMKKEKEEKRNLALQIKQQHEQLTEELEQIEIETKKIDPEYFILSIRMKDHTHSSFRALKRVQVLVAEYEIVKKQESERRATYKQEKNELDEEINQLQARLQSSTDLDSEESEKMKQIDEQYQLVADRLQKQKLILVKIIQY